MGHHSYGHTVKHMLSTSDSHPGMVDVVVVVVVGIPPFTAPS